MCVFTQMHVCVYVCVCTHKHIPVSVWLYVCARVHVTVHRPVLSHHINSEHSEVSVSGTKSPGTSSGGPAKLTVSQPQCSGNGEW